MEKKNSNGSSSSSMVVRLPPGFRFHPTDEELVVQYLKRKVFSCPLPASIIPDLPHLYSNSDPWDLPGDAEQERYFFSTKEAKYPNGNRSNRATNSGYWKATGLDKQVLSSCKNTNQHQQVVEVVGMKKTLVFYSGKPPHGSRTDWIMHEYRLLPHPAAHPLPNWVLCRIFLKRRGAAAATAAAIASKEVSKKKNSSSKVVFYDFFLAHNNNNSNSAPASSSSATCSVITDLSTNDDTDSSSTNTFPFSYFTYK